MRSLPTRIYRRELFFVEIGLVYLLVALVTTGSAFLILARSLPHAAWDMAWLTKAIYGWTFYLCLMGTVLASRRASHIAIDIVPHLVSEKTRILLQRISWALGAAAAFLLMGIAWHYCFDLIRPEDTFVAGAQSWWWRARTWKAPMIGCFFLIGLHLAVAAVRGHPDRRQEDEAP